MSDDEMLLPEDLIHVEDCVCEHDPDQHDWEECCVDGCSCKGHWCE